MTLNIVKLPTHFLPKNSTSCILHRHYFESEWTPPPPRIQSQDDPPQGGGRPSGKKYCGGGPAPPSVLFRARPAQGKRGEAEGGGEREGKKASADLK